VLTTLSPYRQSSVNQQIVARSQAHYSICANNKDTLAIDGWPVIFNTMWTRRILSSLSPYITVELDHSTDFIQLWYNA